MRHGAGEESSPYVFSLDEFGAFFRTAGPWVLWIGSAVSVEEPASVPMAPAIIGALLRELASGSEPCDPAVEDLLRRGRCELDRNGRHDLLARRVPFEVVLGEVANHTEVFVTRLLQELMPPGAAAANGNHDAIAKLLGHGVDLVVTTNFDECLEAAFGDPPLSRAVPTAGRFDVPRRGLLKVHGTVSDPASLAATPEGLAMRISDAWRDSLADALAGRDVLFVGYGFNDPFDIQPALRLAVERRARIYWACRDGETDVHRIGLPVAGLAPNDLADPRRNLLRVLADAVPASAAAGPVRGMASIEQWTAAVRAVERTRDVLLLSADRKLAALAALFYWIEEGDLALRYFGVAARCPGATSVDRHTLARASLRARRCRRAVRLFDAMLREELPAADPARAIKEIDWCIGAGHVARTGGRRGLARSYFARAGQALARSGLRLEEMPYLADQYMRSQAGEELERARTSTRAPARGRHLARAEAWMDRLDRVEGLALSTRPLLLLERARFEILRGDRSKALGYLDEARHTIDPLRDLHVVTMCDRLTAIASGERGRLVELAEEARARSQWVEWAKIRAEAAGFTGYGEHLRMERALRNLLLATWDLAKEVLRPV